MQIWILLPPHLLTRPPAFFTLKGTNPFWQPACSSYIMGLTNPNWRSQQPSFSWRILKRQPYHLLPCERRGFKRPTLWLWPVSLGFGSLRTGRRYYINRAQTKRKETAPEKTILISTLGSGWACVYPGLDEGPAGGSWPGAICKSWGKKRVPKVLWLNQQPRKNREPHYKSLLRQP